MSKCEICPRNCGADRSKVLGFCGGSEKSKLAKVMVHMWEEPCISGEKGSGAVFFSGCSLKCAFCQNYKISGENFGKEISDERLAKIFLELQEKGVHNINLVNPTHYVVNIINALDLVKSKIKIPVIYNSSGYEKDTIKMLDGYIDVYLPDIKYMDSSKSSRYSKASNYFEYASKAVPEMFRQVGPIKLDYDNTVKKGLIIRHLIMPGSRQDSINIINWINDNFNKEEIFISIMSQYLPFYKSEDYPEINRKLWTFEYKSVVDEINRLNFNKGYIQEKSSSSEEYIPDFNLEGV